MKFFPIFSIPIIILFVTAIPVSVAHNVSVIEKASLDITPVFKQSRFGTLQIDIHKDTTMVLLGEINDFTVRHGIIGIINVTGFDLNFD